MAHFFPDLGVWLGELLDTRDQNRITYSRGFLTWETLLGLALKLGSRRQIRFELDSPEALANLNGLAGSRQETLAHSDTLHHFLGHVPPASPARLRRQMVQRLVRMKVLDSGRLRGRFLVVIDGTGQLRFRKRHCPHCLTQTHGAQTLYFHHVLEAKLVTPEGLAISVGSEFIENTDPQASKQDCEMKAFARLAERLKKDFPQLSLCLLLDGLYANGTMMDRCAQNRWKYIVTFKEGSLPALWSEYQSLRDLCPQNRRTHTTPGGVRQTFAWVGDLEHVDDQKRRHRVQAFQCQEQGPGGKEGETEHFFAWLTNWSVTAENVVDLANRGGRCRWKIENEGFNLQKNGGFHLEHAYSTKPWPIKNFYVLLQIAHLILQLLERSSLLTHRPQALFGSLRNLARRLGESLRNALIPAEALDPAAAAALHIRLNTS